MPASRCTWRRSTARTTIILPNPASKVWRERCARPSRSTRARPAKFPRPRARSAGDDARSWKAEQKFRRGVMAVYTVHEPPLRRYETTTDPDRFVFVRDGFSFWAFLFGPLWMLRHRMWLALACYLTVMGALQIGLHQLEAPGEIASLVGFLFALLIGVEAGTLRRF